MFFVKLQVSAHCPSFPSRHSCCQVRSGQFSHNWIPVTLFVPLIHCIRWDVNRPTVPYHRATHQTLSLPSAVPSMSPFTLQFYSHLLTSLNYITLHFIHIFHLSSSLLVLEAVSPHYTTTTQVFMQ